MTMRRRTVTHGSNLSGAAHNGAEHQIYGAAPTYAQRQALMKQGKRVGYGRFVPQAAYYARSGYGNRGYGGKAPQYGRQASRYGKGSYRAPAPYRNANGYLVAGKTAYGRAPYGKTSARYGKAPARYNGAPQRGGYRQDSYSADQRYYSPNGRYGRPDVYYSGPGKAELAKQLKRIQYREHPELGKGIVIGKFTRTNGGKKKIVDFHEEEIAGVGSQMYKDAVALAKRSGQGASNIDLNRLHYGSINYGADGAAKAIIAEDVPNAKQFDREIDVPTVNEAMKKH